MADIDRDYVASAKVLHISGIGLAISASACDACYLAVEAAKAAGRMVSFDTNLRLQALAEGAGARRHHRHDGPLRHLPAVLR